MAKKRKKVRKVRAAKKKAVKRIKLKGRAARPVATKKLGRAKPALKGRKLPVRYRNPKNRKETWAGRGLKPRWLVAVLKSRKNKLADFAV